MLELDADPRADLLAPSFSLYKANLEKNFYISPFLPEDTQKELYRVKKLLIHSYSEYEFIDVALLYISITFEKCLKQYYKQHNPKCSEKRLQEMMFTKLIKWANRNNRLEIYNPRFINNLIYIRNTGVHNENYRLMGTTVIGKIHTILKLINNQVEAPSKIKSRQIFKKLINTKLQKEKNNGGIYTDPFDNKYLIFDCECLFINNKQCPEEYTFAIMQIVDLQKIIINKKIPLFIVLIDVTDLRLKENKLHAIEKQTRKSITIEMISDKVNQKKFTEWLIFYNKNKNELIEFDMEMRNILSNLFINEWDKYQKLPNTLT